MLYFSKIKIITVILITVIFTYFSFSNLFKFDDNFFKNKINLGLDFQGGSYLLLEIDNKPIISQTLQSKLIDLKKNLNDKNFGTRNYNIKNNKIFFESDPFFIDQVKEVLLNKNGTPLHVAGKIRRNTWQGRTSVQLVIDDIALV